MFGGGFGKKIVKKFQLDFPEEEIESIKKEEHVADAEEGIASQDENAVENSAVVTEKTVLKAAEGKEAIEDKEKAKGKEEIEDKKKAKGKEEIEDKKAAHDIEITESISEPEDRSDKKTQAADEQRPSFKAKLPDEVEDDSEEDDYVDNYNEGDGDNEEGDEEESVIPWNDEDEEISASDKAVPTEKGAKGGRIKKVFLGLGIVLLAFIMTFGFSLWSEYSRKTTKGKDIQVEISEGTSTKQMGAVLKEKGILRYEIPFYVKMYFSPYKGKLRYGVFTLNDGMSLDDIIKKLSTGGAQKAEHVFTVPEGYSVEMIAKKLEKENIMTAEEFLQAVTAAASNSEYKEQLPDASKVFYQLQGYFYPDTYYISDNTTAEELVQKFLTEFNAKFDKTRQEQAASMGLTVEEVLIRASLVQKETERAEEYPIIAGVINNRIAKGMNLQFDSTVVYAMSEGLYGVDRVLYADLKVDSPYNTYRSKGLPVGPICNPSLAAIDGVLNPDKNEYLYFQTDAVKNDGSNLYFKTYEEHAAAAATTETQTSGTTNTFQTAGDTTADTTVATTAATTQNTDATTTQSTVQDEDTSKSNNTNKS